MDLTDPALALRSLARRGVDGEELACATRLLAVLDELKALPSTDRGSQGSAGTDNDKAIWALIRNARGDLCKLLSDENQWESHAAGFLVASHLLSRVSTRDTELDGASRDVLAALTTFAEAYLSDKEPRLRSCVVALVEQLARADGPGTWYRFGPVLCELIESSFYLDETERARTAEELAAANALKSVAEQQAFKDEQAKKPALVHETIGWKALETSMRGLGALIRGRGAGFVADGNLDWRDSYVVRLVTERSLLHENRYVREGGYDVCADIAAAVCAHSGGKRCAHTDALAPAVRRGLEDNWSQVRFAASVAARNLICGLMEDDRLPYLPELVPRLCLNRYYLAEGVRLYSQETWRRAFPGEKGVAVVMAHMEQVVDFYCAQSRADNHGVREAACHCIAELSAQVPREHLSKSVPLLLDALLDCFRDDSWPVRDAACVATGRFVTGFAEESKPAANDLFKLWFDHLSDNIWSVREDSAAALGDAMKAYPEEGLAKVIENLPALLEKFIEPDAAGVNKENHSHEHLDVEATDILASPIPGSPSSPSSPSFNSRAVAGAESVPRNIIKGSLNNLHTTQAGNDGYTNQQLFSCGSLAPKLKRRGVGCMDHGHARMKKNWEFTDGAIYLVKELAMIKPDIAKDYMPALQKIAHYGKHLPEVQVTLWKQLPPIAKALGKRPFKQHLEPFLPNMIASLSSDNQLTASAAADCIMFLNNFLGHGIFRGRIEQLMDGSRLWDQCNSSPLVNLQHNM